MSINYHFTDRGTIQIWCGDDWIEVRLPGGGDGGGTGARPRSQGPDLSDPSTGAQPNATPGEDDWPDGPPPPIPPGSMSFVGMLGRRGQAPMLLMRVPPRIKSVGTPSFERAVQAVLQAAIARQLKELPLQRSQVRAYEVDVNAAASLPTLSEAQIRILVQTWGQDLDASGLGAQEELE